MQDLAGLAIDTAVGAGAGYADSRVVQRRAQLVATKNGEVDSVSDSETEGVGVRVLVDGAWGFAGDPRLSEEGARDAALRAVAFARASASRARTRVDLAPIPPASGEYSAPMERDPVDVPLEEKIALCLRAEEGMRRPEVKITEADRPGDARAARLPLVGGRERHAALRGVRRRHRRPGRIRLTVASRTAATRAPTEARAARPAGSSSRRSGSTARRRASARRPRRS